MTGIEETSVRALVKLEQVLPAHLRRRVSALGSATIAPPAAGPTVDPQHLTVIAAACRDLECLRFAYRSRDGTDTRREVEPHSLVNLGRRWYLVAWDRPREDWRTFRVDRLDRPASTGVGFAARRLPARDAAAYVEQSIFGAPNRYEARVTVQASIEEISSRCRRTGATFEPIDAAQLRVPDGRRRPRLAGDADRDARRGLRGSRAAGADRAPAGAGAAARAGDRYVPGGRQYACAVRFDGSSANPGSDVPIAPIRVQASQWV